MPADPANPFVLSSQRVATREGLRAASVSIQDGRIAHIGAYQQDQREDLGHLVLLPGLVDAHAHLNDPGRADWEGFESGTAAAAAGGVTTLVDMPLNSSPVTTTPAALDKKRAAAAGRLWMDVGFYAGLIDGNAAELPALLDAGVLGVKAFLCHSGLDEFPAATEADLRAAMPLIAERGSVLLAHAELVTPTEPPANPRSYAQYAASRPPAFEHRAIELLIRLCRELGCRTHIVHLADAGSLPMIAAAKAAGAPLTVETCPHYLTFAAEEIPDGATQYKCAPPIRHTANREALWRGLADGVIDFIASDHSPCPPAMKQQHSGRFDHAWGGVSSLQLMLPAVWTEASRRGHTLDDLARWLSYAPASMLGLPTSLTVGADANLVVFDPDATFTVRGEELLHRHKLTPYVGRSLRGVVRRTYLRGQAPRPGQGRVL